MHYKYSMMMMMIAMKDTTKFTRLTILGEILANKTIGNVDNWIRRFVSQSNCQRLSVARTAKNRASQYDNNDHLTFRDQKFTKSTTAIL